MIPVYILSGGYSSRFGRDKARVKIRDKELLRIVGEELKFLGPVTIIADRFGKYEDLGFETVGDIWPHLGPMGGLFSAILHASSGGELGYRTLWKKLRDIKNFEGVGEILKELDCDGDRWLFLSACDLAGVKGRWALTLLEASISDDFSVVEDEPDNFEKKVGSGDFSAVCFGEPLEPLFAIYKLSILHQVFDSIVEGKRAMKSLLIRSGVLVVSRPQDWGDMVPINRPEDLERYLGKKF